MQGHGSPPLPGRRDLCPLRTAQDSTNTSVWIGLDWIRIPSEKGRQAVKPPELILNQ